MVIIATKQIIPGHRIKWYIKRVRGDWFSKKRSSNGHKFQEDKCLLMFNTAIKQKGQSFAKESKLLELNYATPCEAGLVRIYCYLFNLNVHSHFLAKEGPQSGLQ